MWVGMGPKFGRSKVWHGSKIWYWSKIFVGQNQIFVVFKKLLVQKGLRDENLITISTRNQKPICFFILECE